LSPAGKKEIVIKKYWDQPTRKGRIQKKASNEREEGGEKKSPNFLLTEENPACTDNA